MTNEEIKNKIEELANDYGFSIDEVEFSDDERYAILVNDDGVDLMIDLDGLNQDNLEDKFMASFKDALEEFDPAEQAEELGYIDSTDDYDRITNLQDTSDEFQRLANSMATNFHYTSFQDSQMEELEWLNHLAISDGYDYNNLALMKRYAQDAYAVANCGKLYESLKEAAKDPNDINLAPVNFFRNIESGKGFELVTEYQKKPEDTINEAIKFLNLETK